MSGRRCGAVQRAVRTDGDSTERVAAAQITRETIEAGEHPRAIAARQLEHCSVAARAAALRRAVEVARGIGCESGLGSATVETAGELVEHSEGLSLSWCRSHNCWHTEDCNDKYG